jgi:hypothetical protein
VRATRQKPGFFALKTVRNGHFRQRKGQSGIPDFQRLDLLPEFLSLGLIYHQCTGYIAPAGEFVEVLNAQVVGFDSEVTPALTRDETFCIFSKVWLCHNQNTFIEVHTEFSLWIVQK